MAPEVLEAATGNLESALALAGGVARWAEVKVTGFRGDSRVALLGRLRFCSQITGQ